MNFLNFKINFWFQKNENFEKVLDLYNDEDYKSSYQIKIKTPTKEELKENYDGVEIKEEEPSSKEQKTDENEIPNINLSKKQDNLKLIF